MQERSKQFKNSRVKPRENDKATFLHHYKVSAGLQPVLNTYLLLYKIMKDKGL